MMKNYPHVFAMNHFRSRNRSPHKAWKKESSPQVFQGKIEKFIIKTMTQNTMFPFFCALSCTTYPQWPIPSKYPRIAHARHQPLTLDQPMEPCLSTRHDCIDCISLRVACINSLLFGAADWQVSVAENPGFDSFYSRIPGISCAPKNITGWKTSAEEKGED